MPYNLGKHLIIKIDSLRVRGKGRRGGGKARIEEDGAVGMMAGDDLGVVWGVEAEWGGGVGVG